MGGGQWCLHHINAVNVVLPNVVTHWPVHITLDKLHEIGPVLMLGHLNYSGPHSGALWWHLVLFCIFNMTLNPQSHMRDDRVKRMDTLGRYSAQESTVQISAGDRSLQSNSAAVSQQSQLYILSTVFCSGEQTLNGLWQLLQWIHLSRDCLAMTSCGQTSRP